MPINKALITSLLFLTASTISVVSIAQEKKKSRTRPVIPYNHSTLNAPPNMIYIRGGSTAIQYSQSSTDTNSIKRVSLTSFFIDKTEITNQQYRQFTEWVIDSIAIVRYLQDDGFFLGSKGVNEKDLYSENQTSKSTDSGSVASDSMAVTKTVIVAPTMPAVPDSEITTDSVVVDNTPEVVKNEVQEILKKALQGITFETAKDIIRPSSYPILEQVVVALRENPTYNLQINGHTDNHGKADANQILSEKRANAVKNYLVNKGIDAGRLRTAGYGGTQPIADNATAEGREKNRRVEFIADIPQTNSSTTTTSTSSKKTKTYKVTKMVMRKVPLNTTTTSSTVSVDTAKVYDTIKRRIDWSRVNHRKIFSPRNTDFQKKLAPLLDENGEIRKDAYLFAYKYLKTNNNTLIASNDKGKHYTTEVINIYPDEKVWAEDLTNSQTDILVENYFKIAPYDDYPVVGVTWRQARAFCYWRSITAANYSNMPDFMKYYHLTYSLPTEAQWVYAASGYYDMITSNASDTTAPSDAMAAVPADTTMTPHDSTYLAAVQGAMEGKTHLSSDSVKVASVAPGTVIDSTPIHRDRHGMLENFKQGEGDYWQDGSALTLPVMSFSPNEFGLYNMEGNVSEWVLDAYSPSTFSFVSDLNPALLYDADSTDVDAMRRKVVRGGSFMSNAKSLSPYYRDLELDNVAHCYIGFRCILMAPEILFRPVGTRKTRMEGPSKTEVSKRKING